MAMFDMESLVQRMRHPVCRSLLRDLSLDELRSMATMSSRSAAVRRREPACSRVSRSATIASLIVDAVQIEVAASPLR